MKPLLICLLLAAPVAAQTPVTNVAPLPSSTKAAATVAAPLATKSVFIAGLKEPQGMEFDFDGANNLLVCDYGSGEILKFSRDGKALGKLATGLKGPAAIEKSRPTVLLGDSGLSSLSSGSPPPVFYVTERKANRVIQVDGKGQITPLESEIAEPLGLFVTPAGLMAVSHTTSKVYRWQSKNPRINFFSSLQISVEPKGQWISVYSAPSTDGERYGFRWLTYDGAAFFLSDEVGERILMVTSSGRVATFASGISDPSGIVIGPDRMIYVANEGDGGQLIRLNSEGEKTIVAEGLGRPRGLLFVDAKTLLVSNRDGNVWKVVLP